MYEIFLREDGKYLKLKKDEKGYFHTDKGFFNVEDIKNNKVKSSKGVTFLKLNSFSDKLKFIKRGPQTSHLKDLGLIFSHILPQKDWYMLEAGSGSAQASLFFSNYVKEIHSFEINDNFYKISKKNVEDLKINNIRLFNEDIKNANLNKDYYNLIFLDLPDPWEIFNKAYESLKESYYLVLYITSPQQLDKSLKKYYNEFKNKFIIDSIFEVNKRNWEMKIKKGEVFSKPKTVDLTFTALIVIMRKFSRT